QDAVEVGHDAGGGDDVAGQFAADGLDVGQFDVVGVGDGAAAGIRVVGKDNVGADALDLFEDIVAAGEGDGDDEDDAGRADDHAESGQEGPDGVGAEGFDAEAEGLADKPQGTPGGACGLGH